MTNPLNLKDVFVTQAAFGDIIGVSAPAVSGLLRRGVIEQDGSLADWIISYCGNLREQAAGRSMELSEERAGLAREQKLLARIRKQRELGEWAPVENLTLALSKVTSQMASIFDSIPVHLKRSYSEISEDQMTIVRQELAKARNLLVSVGTDAVRSAAVYVADYVDEYDDGNPAQP